MATRSWTSENLRHLAGLFRQGVVDALLHAGVYEKIGSPRRYMFSDTLFVRVLFVAGKDIRPAHRWMFNAYFAATTVFLVALVSGIWMTIGS